MNQNPELERLAKERPFVLALARQLLRDPHAAEDVTQQTLAAALQHPANRISRAWLARVVRNFGYRALRTRRRRTRREVAAAREPHVRDTAATVAHLTWLRHVSDALLRLEEPYRSVLRLRYYDDLTSSEIGTRTGVSASTVRSQIQRGLVQMRAILDATHGDRRSWTLALLPVVLAAAPTPISVSAGVGLGRGSVLVTTKKKVGLTVAILVAFAVTIAVHGNRDSERVGRTSAERSSGAFRDVPTERASEDRADGLPTADVAVIGSAPLTVRVQDAQGMPISGARLRGAVTGPAESLARADTDDDGVAVFPDARPAELLVFAMGYRSARVAVDPSQAELVVSLDRGQFIAGRVATPDGSPVPGARVWAHAVDNLVMWPNDVDRLPDRVVDGNWTRAAENGQFRIDGLKGGSFILRARAGHFSQPAWYDLEPIPSGQGSVTLTMIPTVRVEVIARDARTGATIRGAIVQLVGGLRRGLQISGDLCRGEAAEPTAMMGQDSQGVSRVYYGLPASATPELTIWCAAPGYRRASTTVALKDSITRVTIDLIPDVPGRKGTLRLSAAFPGSDTPFTGSLALRIRSKGSDGHRVVEFVRGHAIEPIELLPGAYRYSVEGAGDVGSFWGTACPPGEFEIHEDGVTPIDLSLRGTPVDLRVLDADGRRVRGYDLVVNTSSGPRGVVQRWDTPAFHTDLMRWRPEYEGPDLILPVGKSRVSAWLPHAGRASPVIVNAEGRGERVVVTLTLQPTE